MRKAYRWLILLVFLIVNGFIIAWVWRSSQTPAPAPAASNTTAAKATDEKTDERNRAFSEHWARTEKLAYELIAEWNRAAVMKLDSDELPAAIESLPQAGCIDLPDGAVPIGSGTVPQPVKQDLDAALTGFIRATAIATADALIDYMRGRSEFVDPKRRAGWEKGLRKKGASDPEKLSDEELYKAIFKPESHWSGLVVESSCRQMWDGKHVPQKNLRFDNSVIDPKTPPSEQALYLLRLLKGTGSSRTSFASTSGSLLESHQNDSRVLLCDVQLVIELDETFSGAKAPYLLRFWFNSAVEKWQLVELVCFASKPDEMSTPGVYY